MTRYSITLIRDLLCTHIKKWYGYFKLKLIRKHRERQHLHRKIYKAYLGCEEPWDFMLSYCNKHPQCQWPRPDKHFSPAFTVHTVGLCQSQGSSKDSDSFHHVTHSSSSVLSWLSSCVHIPAYGKWKDPKPRASGLPTSVWPRNCPSHWPVWSHVHLWLHGRLTGVILIRIYTDPTNTLFYVHSPTGRLPYFL